MEHTSDRLCISFLWLTNYHKVSDLNNRNLFSHSSGENLENTVLEVRSLKSVALG